MKNYFNYTDRQDNIRKTGSNPEIKVIVKEKDDITEYEPIINFDKERKLPLDARVFIQAYSSEGFVGKPEDFGAVSKPDIKIVKESDVGKDEIKFRLKVVSTKNKLKKILATCYKIVPWGTNTWLRIGTREQDCLIEYEIVPAEIPVLYFQKGYGLERDLEQSNYLKAIQFNNAVREVLRTYITKSETFEDCKVRKVWIEKFEDLTGDDFPKKDDDDLEIENWLNKAISSFLEEKLQGLGAKSLMELMPDSSILLKDKLTHKVVR